MCVCVRVVCACECVHASVCVRVCACECVRASVCVLCVYAYCVCMRIVCVFSIPFSNRTINLLGYWYKYGLGNCARTKILDQLSVLANAIIGSSEYH